MTQLDLFMAFIHWSRFRDWVLHRVLLLATTSEMFTVPQILQTLLPIFLMPLKINIIFQF